MAISSSSSSSTVAEGGRVMWRMKLQSAFRTVLACTIVGCATLYGPPSLRTHLTFPAFSYVTAILIVSDANLGDTLRGCWHAFYATVQVVPVCMLSLRIIGPGRISPPIAALGVALTSFFLGLPESTDLMSKRIGFGQIVIVYVDAVIHSRTRNHQYYPNAFMHPLHVASSTALGAISAFLALLLPYPRLAYSEVRKLCLLYAENSSERINLYLKALTAKNRATAIELISQTKPLASTGNKLLRTITLMQEGVLWEKPWIRFTRPNFPSPEDKLQEMEIPMRGMEIALDIGHPLPAGVANEKISNVLLSASPLLGLTLEQARRFLPFSSVTIPEPIGELVNRLIVPHETILSIHKDLSACFLLSCAQQLIDNSVMRPVPVPEAISDSVPKREEARDSHVLAPTDTEEVYARWIVTPNNGRLIFASKCSISLGLAVLIGLLFNIENGYWSGLTIAISFVVGRQATFTVANARAQGTAIGSVYGVLGCFVFERFAKIRCLALLPWIIFTSFLRHSRMYGHAGGISAVIGALLILGRNNYGLPNEFAIARLTEAIIGLCCFILVELLCQPTMASTLAKRHLYLSLLTLQECIKQIVLSSQGKDQSSMEFKAFQEKQRNLKSHVYDLENSMEEAEREPNFWFLPFRGSCYQKLHRSLSNMSDLMHCMAYSLEFLFQVSQNHSTSWKETQGGIDDDLEICQKFLSSSLRCLEKAGMTKSNNFTKKKIKSMEPAQEMQDDKIFHDLERGNCTCPNMFSAMEDKQTVNFAKSFLQRLKKDVDKIKEVDVEEELKGKMVLCLSALGFGISCLMKETEDTERGIKELIHWENPSSQLYI